MKHWQETAAILDHVPPRSSGRRAALATVVRISGSAYRRPGAKLIIEESGSAWGSVSGGCLEADVRSIALEVIRSQRPRLRHYETGSDESMLFGLGLGCEGSVEVFVQPVPETWPPDVFRRLPELIEARTPFALSTLLDGPRAGLTQLWTLSGRGACVAGASGEGALDDAIGREATVLLECNDGRALQIGPRTAFVEALSPPPRLVVFGAGDDARPFAELAVQVGFDVTVVDHRPAYLTPERFPAPVLGS